jgi:hypothetical protein
MSIDTKNILPIREGTGTNATIKSVGGFIATVRKIHISLNINLQKTFESTARCKGKDVELSRTATFSLNASETFDVCGCGFPIETTFPATIRNEGTGMVYENNKCFTRSYNDSQTLGVGLQLHIVFPSGDICYDKPSPTNSCDRPIYDVCFYVGPDSNQPPSSSYPMPFLFFTCFTGCMYPSRTFRQNYIWGDGEIVGSATLSIRVQTNK